MMLPQYLYLVGQNGDEAVKIGVSTNPVARLASIQTGHPQYLRLVETWEIKSNKAVAVERIAHRQLAAWRLRGEWFAVGAAQAKAAITEVLVTTRYGEDLSPYKIKKEGSPPSRYISVRSIRDRSASIEDRIKWISRRWQSYYTFSSATSLAAEIGMTKQEVIAHLGLRPKGCRR